MRAPYSNKGTGPSPLRITRPSKEEVIRRQKAFLLALDSPKTKDELTKDIKNLDFEGIWGLIRKAKKLGLVVKGKPKGVRTHNFFRPQVTWIITEKGIEYRKKEGCW